MNTPDSLVHLHRNFATLLRKAGLQVAPEKVETSAQFTRCLTGFSHPLANLALPGHQTEEQFKALLADTENWSTRNRAPVAAVLFPDAGGPERAAWAEERKWVRLDNMPGMWLDHSDSFGVGPLAPGIEVSAADDDAALAQVIRIMAEGYPVPPAAADFFMRGIHLAGLDDRHTANFIARVDGEPAACASVNIHDGVAGIYCVATLERFRGRGLGAAVTRAATLHGFQTGATHALLHASPMGEPIYRKMGYREVCRIPVYGFGLG